MTTTPSPVPASKAKARTRSTDARVLPGDEHSGGFRLRNAAVESPEATRATRLAVARAQRGDREALRYLYARYADNVYSYVSSIVRDHYEAEDVTQQVFAKLSLANAARKELLPESPTVGEGEIMVLEGVVLSG